MVLSGSDDAGRDLVTSITETLPSRIAILDADGTILTMTGSWQEFAETNGFETALDPVGMNYLDIVDAADNPDANRAAAGVRAVLRGDRQQFELEYPCHSPTETRWFLLRASSFTHDGARYATIAYAEITERRQRERALREAYDISVSDRTFSEKVDKLLALGREVLGLDYGTLSHVEGKEYSFEAVAAPEDADLSPGDTASLDTLPNCKQVIQTEEMVVLSDVRAEAPELQDPEWGINAYLGMPVVVNDEVRGTFCFYSTDARGEQFSDWEVTFAQVLSSWVSNALERRHYTDLLGALETAFPDLAYLIDAEGTYHDYLAGSEMTSRLPAPSTELLGQTLHDVLPADTADHLLATIREALDTGQLQTAEYELEVPAGTCWFEARIAPVVHSPYGLETVIIVARDTTERKEHERELQETSEMLRSIHQTMAASDPLSEKLEDLLTFGREYLDLEQGFFTRIDDDMLAIRVSVGPNDQLQAGAAVPLSETYCRHTIDTDTPDPLTIEHASEEGWRGDPSFERFDLECYVGTTIVVDGEVEGTICFADRERAGKGFTDPQQTFIELLSEWTSSELEQREHERQYRRLTERLCDGYYAFDANWTVTYWNDTIVDRSGKSRDEIVGDHFWEQYPELRGTIYEYTLREAMESQEPQSCEFYYEEGDYWVDVQAHPDEAGISVISQEITERKEQEQQLQERRDELAHLNRLNTLTRELIHALQDTDSREAIEKAVCDRLTASELYQGAAIGVRGATVTGDQMVTLQTAAGIDMSALDTFPAFERLAKTAIQTGAVQVIDDIVTGDAAPAARQESALKQDYHALAAIPLTTGGVTYGVLVVHPPGDQTISEDEQTILADLGEMIAQAIQRVHSQQALNAETVVTLDVQFPDTDLLLGEASTKFDCELALEQWVPTNDGGAIYYFDVHGADPGRVSAFMRESSLDCDCTVVREADDDGPARIELRFADQPNLPTDVLSDYGGSMTTVQIMNGDVILGVELPPSVDVRTVIEALREGAANVELLSKQSVDRPITTDHTLQNRITDQLTPKQETTLKAAYARGYYAWPRHTTVEELAESFDISAPTLHYRLRKAHYTIVSAVIDDA